MQSLQTSLWLLLALAGAAYSTGDTSPSCSSTKSFFENVRVLNENGESVPLTGTVYDAIHAGIFIYFVKSVIVHVASSGIINNNDLCRF